MEDIKKERVDTVLNKERKARIKLKVGRKNKTFFGGSLPRG